MKIQSMFKNDIDRNINGVIKVGQDDEQTVQELEEYIITKELRRHIGTFFDSYSHSIDVPTDKIGVWISGFFGSGKSHFLKMLSYVLSDKIVGGKKAVDYFEDKLDDALTYSTIKRCASVPTESILFNIDVESPEGKDKASVLRVFATVFYNHLGFYGRDLKVVRLERYVDKLGKTDEFRRVFEEINGSPWLESRGSYGFLEDDTVAVMQRVLGMTEGAARNWFNDDTKDDFSIAQLIDDIKDYVDSKGANFRLLFCIDEVGQYIGDSGDLMLNLQSIVEELGAKCKGKVWVMVTSQEAIDSVVKIKGSDFSKILARFDTRLSLSSASVDEVIKKRVLQKTDDADKLLHLVYDKEHSVMRNLFVFNNAISDIKGFTSADEFAAAYPFVPYQFIVFQKVLSEIRKHGNTGKHLSGGERSMLSGFQEAAQKIKHKDENALVPFSAFYDTIHTFLESSIRRVIDRCANAADNNDGILPQDTEVLKLLYLIKYIDDIKPNIDNIAVLMADNINADKIVLRKSVADSLNRLEAQNYVARNGDNYTFLTDEEQDVAVEIRNMPVDTTQIAKSIGDIVYDEIYPIPKYKFGSYDFEFDKYIDEMLHGSAKGGVRLRIVTAASDYYNSSEQKFKLDSEINNEAIVVLSDKSQYFDELVTAAKIKKYISHKNTSLLHASMQKIIIEKQAQANKLETNAQKQIEEAIKGATFYVKGENFSPGAGDAKMKLNEAMKQLITDVYKKLGYVNKFSQSDIDILAVLNSDDKQIGMPGSGAENEQAIRDMGVWLETNMNSHLPVTTGDVQKRYKAIPYGWREADIAAVMAALIVAQKVEIHYGGTVIGKDDKNIVKYLRAKTEIDKVTVKRRVAVREEVKRKAVAVLCDLTGNMGVPDDEDSLKGEIKRVLEEMRRNCDTHLNEYKYGSYPQKDALTGAKSLTDAILLHSRDNTAFFTEFIGQADALADAFDDLREIEFFFKSQKDIFDSAVALNNKLSKEDDYLAARADIAKDMAEIAEILGMQKPYGRIKDLTGLMQDVKNAYASMMRQKSKDVNEVRSECLNRISAFYPGDPRLEGERAQALAKMGEFEDDIAAKETLTALDALAQRMQTYTNNAISRMQAMLGAQVQNADPAGAPVPKALNISRTDVIAAKRLTSRDDIDGYAEDMRQRLYALLDENGEIIIN